MQNTAFHRRGILRSLLMVGLVMVLFLRVSGSQDEAQWLDRDRVKKIMAEADAACVELVTYDQSREKSAFSFSSAATLGRMADAYMTQGQLQQARKLLMLDFDPDTAAFLVETSAVKFGAPLPIRTEFSNVNEEYRWKLSLLISLAHGGRFMEAAKMLDRFPAEHRSIPTQIRYLNLIAKKCIELGDEVTGKKVLSQSWNRMKSLEPDDPTRLTEALKLLQLAQKLSTLSATESLIDSINDLMNDASLMNSLKPEQTLDLLMTMGQANVAAGQFDSALRMFEAARAQLGKVNDEFFDPETKSSQWELAVANLYAQQKQPEQASVHARRSLEYLTQIDDTKRQSQAKALDGGQGLFSAAFNFASGSGFVDLILWHDEMGNDQEAEQIWNQMPLSYQKLNCQIKLAKRKVSLKQLAAAARCAEACLKLINDQTPVGSQLSIKIAAAHIYQECGQLNERDRIIDSLLADPRIMDSDQLKQRLASELAELELFQRAYSLTQKIEAVALRAGPLTRIALKGATLHKR